jgi:hypothetical protein
MKIYPINNSIMKCLFFTLILGLALLSCTNNQPPTQDTKAEEPTERTAKFEAQKAATAPTIDGRADDACWQSAAWHSMDQRWLGPEYTPEDFTGRYKLSWDENFIYVLAEIQDDTLIDIHEDGLDFYWDDDCLEIFVDEDHSGGNHQYSHNAFAYHIALDNRVVDIGPDSLFRYYTDHITSRRTQDGNTSIWEVAISIYDDSYTDGGENTPVKLNAGKRVGFAIAYCDNDRSANRENFIGSVFVPGEDKNRGWIDAGIFGTLVLEP